MEKDEISDILKKYIQETGRFSEDSYFPIENQFVFKFAAFLFGTFPCQVYYEEADFVSLKNSLEELKFTEIFQGSKFEKESEKNSIYSQIYISLEYKSILLVKIGDETYNDFPESIFGNRDKEKAENNNLVYIDHFYDISLSKEKLDIITNKLKKAALEESKLKIKKNSINFLCFDHSFRLKNVKIKRKVENSLELNYNSDFIKIHDHLMNFLKSDDTGLCILRGIYGTGKTSYLRYLLSILDKKVIYIPPHLINRVAEPDFLNFLLNQNDFVLVIEDAEEIITNRKDTNNISGVSNLLNLSDGILGDCIKVKIIVTFNADIDNIDPALLRKGRLKLDYEFKELDIDVANKLFEHLGIDYVTTEKMSLADVYNKDVENFKKEKIKKTIGFGV